MRDTDFRQVDIAHQRVGDAPVLDALALGDGRAKAFFAIGTRAAQITGTNGTEIEDIRSVGDGMIVTLTHQGGAMLAVDGLSTPLTLHAPELTLFEGLNTALAVRGAESAQTTLAWLGHHARTHGLQAALILDRQPPGTDDGYAEALRAGLAGIEGLRHVLLLRIDLPLGNPELPPEAHPFNAPGAPGKDRMKVPARDPWSAPLREVQIYEWLRHRYLDRARAVAALDISDILPPPAEGAGTVFDAAVGAASGVVQLAGRQCYPWRVRKGQDCGFGDHLCLQFDSKAVRRRWCVAPAVAGADAVWRMVRIVGTAPQPETPLPFYRCMGLRHPGVAVSRIVPKTSLVEDEALMAMMRDAFDAKPLRMPTLDRPDPDPDRNRTCIITCMKNEGPFILEWLAYHRAIGVQDVIVYTNDCTDGTDRFLDLLQDKGLVQHRDNPFKGTGLKPQHAALQAGENEPVVQNADWVVSMDVDEFINIKVGDGTLGALFDVVGEANLISMTWRLFGNSDIHAYRDGFLIQDFTRCAHEITRKPHQAWGFKTLFRNIGLFKKLGVHRPKGLNPQLWDQIRWVNGSNKPLPKEMFRNAWRSTLDTVGYDVVTLNHYAVRSAESFLVKRDRGRVNHVDRDQGLAYWFRMNNNSVEDTSIQRMIPALRAEYDRLMADPDIAAMHAHCVAAHRAKIDELRATANYARFYDELCSERMERLSRMHQHFGANVFLAGPEVIPDEIALQDNDANFFFTVDRRKTTH